MAYDIIAFGTSCLMILAYYLYLRRRTRRAPQSSVHAVNARTRERWVDMVVSSGKMEILAIQTLRNSVMAANFMASTAILLIIGTLNLSDKIGHWSLEWRPFAESAAAPVSLWHIKLGLLLLDFSIAFFCFSMAIRFFNHVGYMINLPAQTAAEGELFKQTCAYLNRAGSYYTLGTRTFFFSLPIILWFFGPYFLLMSTPGLVAALAMLDRTPN